MQRQERQRDELRLQRPRTKDFMSTKTDQEPFSARRGSGAERNPCPQCGERETIIAMPTTFKESMWDGWDGAWECPRCSHRWDRPNAGDERRVPAGSDSCPAPGSESPAVMVAGIRLIITTLGAALVTLKQEGGGCLATKMLINNAISTGHEILGSQNDQAHGQP